ncbi:hypothetical protein KC330_g7052 [Hortaea werneckii]|nr:hypothetical protein KC330_g7052 [Hortaea werneckii]
MAIANLLPEVSYPHLVLTTGLIAITYLLSAVVYRLYFHPLAKYPGPFWARLSVIPSWWHTQKQDRHVWLYSLQEEYGTTFRYRPDAVLVNTPTAFKTIFGPRGNVKKSDDYYRVWPKTIDVKSTWNVTDVHEHARKRRVLNHAFSEKALRSAEPSVHSNVDRWLDLFQEQGANGAKSFNMAHKINYLVFDILGDLCFGKSFGMKEPNSEVTNIPEILAEFLSLMNPICFSPFASWWVWLKPRGLDYLINLAAPPALKNWENFVGRCRTERSRVQDEYERQEKPEAEQQKDFFYWFWHAIDPETGRKGYDLNELYGELELMIVAGSDTTSIVMSAMLFYMARNPDIQAKLAAEVRSTFTEAGEIKAGAQLSSCKYLRAFIQEACRMNAPVPAEPARTVMAGGTTVDGEFFPEGTKISIGMYCLSYNREIYPEPFKFSPERWIVDEKDPASRAKVEAAESAFCAFSFGSRGCIGKNLAWLEMSIVMAKLVHRFEVKQDPASKNLGGGAADKVEGRRDPDQYQLYEAFVALRDGPTVQFHPGA